MGWHLCVQTKHGNSQSVVYCEVEIPTVIFLLTGVSEPSIQLWHLWQSTEFPSEINKVSICRFVRLTMGSVHQQPPRPPASLILKLRLNTWDSPTGLQSVEASHPQLPRIKSSCPTNSTGRLRLMLSMKFAFVWTRIFNPENIKT